MYFGRYFIDHLLRCHTREGSDDSLIPASGKVMLYLSGIDTTAVGEHPSHLLPIKGDLVPVIDGVTSLYILVCQAIDQPVLFQGKTYDLRCIFRSNLLVLDTQRIDGYYRRLGTQAVAPGGAHLHPIGEALFAHFSFKGIPYLRSPVRPAPSHTNMYPGFSQFLLSKNLVAVPFQFPYGGESFHAFLSSSFSFPYWLRIVVTFGGDSRP
jgi:hypothetical protein